MIYINDQLVATAERFVEISFEDYEALPDEVKNNGDIYMVSDEVETDPTRIQLNSLKNIIGTMTLISGGIDGTIIGGINNIYDRLGGLSFRYDEETAKVITDYDPIDPSEAVIVKNTDSMTDEEMVAYLSELIGDETKITDLGFSSVTDAILSLFNRLGGIRFRYNTDTATVEMVTD